MATIEQANAYFEVRENEDWAELEPALKTALLQDAQDYILSAYSIRQVLNAYEERLLDVATYRLAALFAIAPPKVASAPSIKKESKEGANIGKKEVEYFEASVDPYPYITALVRPLLASASTGQGIYQGWTAP